MVAQLKDLDVVEVSLVDRAANRRKFLLMKRDGEEGREMDDAGGELVLEVGNAALAALLKRIAEGSADRDAVEEALEKMELSERARMAVRAALRALESAKDELPKDIIMTLAALGGYTYPEAKAGEEQQMPKKPEDEDEKMKAQHGSEDDDEEEKMKAKDKDKYSYPYYYRYRKNEDGTETLELDMEKVPEDVRPLAEALWKAQQEAVAKADRLAKELSAERERLQKEREERQRQEYIQKAEREFRHLPVSAQDLGPVLLKMERALDKAEFELVCKALAAGNEALSQQFRERGGEGEGMGTSAYDKLMAKAAEIKKRDGCSIEKAFTKALDEYPELARAEREERNRAH